VSFRRPADAANVPAGIAYSGAMWSVWNLIFDVRFTVDRAAHTVDAEPAAPGATPNGVVLSSRTRTTAWGTYSLTASLAGATPTTFAMPGVYDWDPSGSLSDGWGYGPSTTVYASGRVGLVLSGNPSRPTFHCSNGGGFDFEQATAAGLGDHLMPLSIPLADLGKKDAFVRQEGTALDDQPTLLGAVYTGVVDASVTLVDMGSSEAPALSELAAAGQTLDGWLQLIPHGDYRDAAGAAHTATTALKGALEKTPAADRAARAGEQKAIGEMTVVDDFSPSEYGPALTEDESKVRGALEEAQAAASAM
jgi:hypothetical protein